MVIKFVNLILTFSVFDLKKNLRAIVFKTTTKKTLFTAAIFSLGVVTGFILKLESAEIISAAVTLCTAFAGAFFAFKLNANREAARIVEERADSANKVIYSLIQAYNFLEGIRKDFVAPFKDSPAPHYAIQPILGADHFRFKVDYSSISFLILARKSEILSEINELEEICFIFLDVLKHRNHIHANIVQPAMSNAGFKHGDPLTPADIENVLGNHIERLMQSTTNNLIGLVERGVKKSEMLIEKMHTINKELFPGFNIIRMEKVS